MLSRSFHPVTTLVTFMLMLLGLVSGCLSDSVSTQPTDNSNQVEDVSSDTGTFVPQPGDSGVGSDLGGDTEVFTQEEVNSLVAEMISSNSGEVISGFNEGELASFVDSLQEYGIYPDLEGMPAPPPSSLPWCGSYWGHYATAETIEQRNSTSGMLYHVGPNCYMWAPDSDTSDELNGDCSSASDNDTDDFMLSFYFGNHSESPGTLKSMLKWTSSSVWVRALLGSLSGRLYDQTAGDGADNYNVYTCLDDYFDPYLTTFDLRKF